MPYQAADRGWLCSRLLIVRWYTPAGINIGQKGITPDVTIELSNDDYNANRDPQLDKALDLLK